MNNTSTFNLYEYRLNRNAYPGDTHYFYESVKTDEYCNDVLERALDYCFCITYCGKNHYVDTNIGGIGIITPFSYE